MAVTQIESFQPEALGSLTIQRLERFSNWTTGLAIRFYFMLVPETYHSFFENFESLMYDFILPILLAKWLHAGTSATSKKLRPRQLTPLSQSAALSAPTLGHPASDGEGCCVPEQTGLSICEDLCLDAVALQNL